MQYNEICVRSNELKVILLGESGVGKSSFLYQFRKGVFKERESTKEVDYSVKRMKMDNKDVVLGIWDTAGQERHRSLVRSYYRGADGALLVYDVTDVSTFNKLSEWLKDIRQHNKDTLVMIVGNKNEESEAKVVDEATISQFCLDENLQFAEVSAKTGENVEMVFKYLVQQILVTRGVLPPREVQPWMLSSEEEADELTAAAVRILPALVSAAARKIISPESSDSPEKKERVRLQNQTSSGAAAKKCCC